MKRPSPHRAPLRHAAAALTLAYGVGLWLVVLQAAEHEHGGPGLLANWLRNSTFALPAVLVAVWAAASAAPLLLRRASASTALERCVLAAALAVGASAAFGAGTPVFARLFEVQDTNELPLLVQALRDTLLALVAALPLAGMVTLAPAADARIVRPRSLRPAAVALVAVLAAVVLARTEGSASAAAALSTANSCLTGQTDPTAKFEIFAIDLKIPLNRFGDHDRDGKMFVLKERLNAVQEEEARFQRFLDDQAHRDRGFVTPGLRGDAIQALVIRANEGDCVEITFTNNASGAFGLHIDGLAFGIDSSGDQIGANASSAVERGHTTKYRYWIANDPALEGAHYMHPGPGNRAAVSHGLFGALVVEPPGSKYYDPIDSDSSIKVGELQPLRSGEEAIVVPGSGAQDAFRDNVTIFHEIGNENSQIFDQNGSPLPNTDPTTDAYRPGSRAVNYRSEPFMDRLRADTRFKALAYDSYTFADAAIPITRGYVHDPMKIRLLHGGGEMFHVYHLHGGGLRWPLEPRVEPVQSGEHKTDTRLFSRSHLLDSQAFGPGESYNLELNGGAGGLQGAVGDFTYHCHIAEHYPSGMWGIRRVFDTLQPDFMPLPGRTPVAPVTSEELVGKTMPGMSRPLTSADLAKWIEPQLPPPGVRENDQDAAVWNWKVVTGETGQPLYLGEPEEKDRTDWPDLVSGVPNHPGSFAGDVFVAGGSDSDRPAILFNPANGRPAYPMLRPHILQRPPFSPNGHTGAPYLGEVANQAPKEDVDPWAGRKDGICPQSSLTAGTPSDPQPQRFNVLSIETEIQITRNPDRIDRDGKILVLAGEKGSVTPATAQPLAIRGNVGECLNLTVVSEQTDEKAANRFAKANLHVHHVQFDPMASDGAIVGFNYEQSVRPYQAPDTTSAQLTQPSQPATLTLSDASRFRPGVWIAVGLGLESIETRRIASVDKSNSRVELTKALDGQHAAGEWVSVEFVQSRWYLDTQLDNVFFHDHVDGIHGWRHGAVGMIIVEPAGAKYLDPKDHNHVMRSGTIVDIDVPPPGKCDVDYNADGVADPLACRLAPGVVDTSFREGVIWMINDNPITDSTLNMHAAPFSDRSSDPAQRLLSRDADDPFTPRITAHAGDPVVFRVINVSPNVEPFHVDGHRFFVENRCLAKDGTGRECTELNGTTVPTSPANISSRTDTAHIGASERYTLILEGGAGGPERVPGDYLYMNGLDRRFRQGAWGIVRVLPAGTAGVQALPDVPDAKPPPCAGTATDTPPLAVSAIDLPSSGNTDGKKAAFIPTADVAAVRNDPGKLEPLVLHVVPCTRLTIEFRNDRSNASASFHVGELLRDQNSSGINVGASGGQIVQPGGTHTYRFLADTAKIGSASISDFGGDRSGKDGLYGMVVVAPTDARFTSGAVPGTDGKLAIGPTVDVACPSDCVVGGRAVKSYRDFALVFSDDDPQIGSDFMPYPTEVHGPALLNYRTAPRRDDTGAAFAGTPPFLLSATAGQAANVHALVAPGSEQTHVLSLGGLSFPLDPQIAQSEEQSNRGFAPWETIDAEIVGGAGGRSQTVGDFFFGDLRRPFTQGGIWTVLRVTRP